MQPTTLLSKGVQTSIIRTVLAFVAVCVDAKYAPDSVPRIARAATPEVKWFSLGTLPVGFTCDDADFKTRKLPAGKRSNSTEWLPLRMVSPLSGSLLIVGLKAHDWGRGWAMRGDVIWSGDGGMSWYCLGREDAIVSRPGSEAMVLQLPSQPGDSLAGNKSLDMALCVSGGREVIPDPSPPGANYSLIWYGPPVASINCARLSSSTLIPQSAPELSAWAATTPLPVAAVGHVFVRTSRDENGSPLYALVGGQKVDRSNDMWVFDFIFDGGWPPTFRFRPAAVTKPPEAAVLPLQVSRPCVIWLSGGQVMLVAGGGASLVLGANISELRTQGQVDPHYGGSWFDSSLVEATHVSLTAMDGTSDPPAGMARPHPLLLPEPLPMRMGSLTPAYSYALLVDGKAAVGPDGPQGGSLTGCEPDAEGTCTSLVFLAGSSVYVGTITSITNSPVGMDRITRHLVYPTAAAVEEDAEGTTQPVLQSEAPGTLLGLQLWGWRLNDDALLGYGDGLLAAYEADGRGGGNFGDVRYGNMLVADRATGQLYGGTFYPCNNSGAFSNCTLGFYPTVCTSGPSSSRCKQCTRKSDHPWCDFLPFPSSHSETCTPQSSPVPLPSTSAQPTASAGESGPEQEKGEPQNVGPWLQGCMRPVRRNVTIFLLLLHLVGFIVACLTALKKVKSLARPDPARPSLKVSRNGAKQRNISRYIEDVNGDGDAIVDDASMPYARRFQASEATGTSGVITTQPPALQRLSGDNNSTRLRRRNRLLWTAKAVVLAWTAAVIILLALSTCALEGQPVHTPIVAVDVTVISVVCIAVTINLASFVGVLQSGHAPLPSNPSDDLERQVYLTHCALLSARPTVAPMLRPAESAAAATAGNHTSQQGSATSGDSMDVALRDPQDGFFSRATRIHAAVYGPASPQLRRLVNAYCVVDAVLFVALLAYSYWAWLDAAGPLAADGSSITLLFTLLGALLQGTVLLHTLWVRTQLIADSPAFVTRSSTSVQVAGKRIAIAPDGRHLSVRDNNRISEPGVVPQAVSSISDDKISPQTLRRGSTAEGLGFHISHNPLLPAFGSGSGSASSANHVVPWAAAASCGNSTGVASAAVGALGASHPGLSPAPHAAAHSLLGLAAAALNHSNSAPAAEMRAEQLRGARSVTPEGARLVDQVTFFCVHPRFVPAALLAVQQDPLPSPWLRLLQRLEACAGDIMGTAYQAAVSQAALELEAALGAAESVDGDASDAAPVAAYVGRAAASSASALDDSSADNSTSSSYHSGSDISSELPAVAQADPLC